MCCPLNVECVQCSCFPLNHDASSIFYTFSIKYTPNLVVYCRQILSEISGNVPWEITEASCWDHEDILRADPNVIPLAFLKCQWDSRLDLQVCKTTPSFQIKRSMSWLSSAYIDTCKSTVKFCPWHKYPQTQLQDDHPLHCCHQGVEECLALLTLFSWVSLDFLL